MWANDTVGNSNETGNYTINVSDGTEPSVILMSPINGYNSSSDDVTFSFNITDNHDTNLTCNLTFYMNNSNDVNVNLSFTALSGQITTKTIYDLSNATVMWNISCSDDEGNANASLGFKLTVDKVYPWENATLLTVNDSDLDGNIEISWIDTSQEQGEKYRIYRLAGLPVNTTTINDATLIATIDNGVQTFEDNTTTHGTNYYYALVTQDHAGNVNLSVISVTLNATADDSKLPRSTTQVNVSSSGGVTIIKWNAVEHDVNGNADTAITYAIWYANNATYNSSLCDNSTINTSCATWLANTTSTSYTWTRSFLNPVYWFFIVTMDDASNVNGSRTSSTSGYVQMSYAQCTNGSSIPSSGCYCGGSIYYSGYCCAGSHSTSACTTSTTTSSSSSSSSSITTTPTTSNIKATSTHVWSLIPAGSTMTMAITNADIPVEEVRFRVGSDSESNAELSVKSLVGKPSSIEADPPGIVNTYLEFSPRRINDITSVTIKFRVEKDWLTNNNVLEQDIVLYRYDDKWEALPTKVTTSDASYVYYESTSPGFSVFVISTKEVTVPEEEEKAEEELNVTAEEEAVTPEEEPAASEEQPEEEKVVPEEKPKAKAWVAWLVIVVILIIGVVSYFIMKPRIEKS